MNGNNEPVAVVPEIEDDKSIHIVGIGKGGSQFLKVPPSSRFHDTGPGANFPGSFAMIFRRLLQALDRDDMHVLIILRNLRSINLPDHIE
jgi:hypothetical protein